MPAVIEELQGYLTPTVAAQRLGVSEVTLRLWVKGGRMPALRTPHGNLFKAEDIERIALARAQHGEGR